MSPGITIATALAAGLLSFFSPCVLPLVPSYLVYLAGTSVTQISSVEPARRVRIRALIAASIFVGGFATVFVPLGAGASAIGHYLRIYLNELSIVAGIAIVVMGLHFLGLTQASALLWPRRIDVKRPAGLWGAYVMGLAFALGWIPCVGPLLAAILAIAASEATVIKGSSLLAVYCIGLGIPFILAAFAIKPFTALLARFRPHLPHVERAMGGLLVLTGLAFLTGFFAQAGFWLLETFPVLERIG
ncbi:MAG: cytochrome c biogenesis protein CcdA [Pseudorhodoplanes sp.]|nr:cytochrome c biogenesis protein CcdA [Pseudorhodoplanes sp.]